MKHLALALLVSCGGDASDLDADAVTNLPPGDATGTAASGSYRMESVTTACGGDCSTTVDGFLYSACDVGTRLDDTARVTQDSGALQIDVDDNDCVSRLDGGLNSDGSYDVGGLRTQLGGQITITARGQGVFAGDTMSGTARLRVTGRGLDCVIETDVDGER
jgi:hypothetical protein